MGALGGAILGDVAATPKMAGLAYEVSCIMVFFFSCWVPGMMVGRRWGECECAMGDGGRRKDEGKKKSFPFPPQSHMASPLFSSIFCSC